MKLFENGVGRPSNEIKKKRRMFIASAIILCIVLIFVSAFALIRVNTKSLKGLANGKKYINLHAKVGDTYVSGCNYVVPAIIENRSQQNIKVYYAKLTSDNNTKYTDVTVNQTIAKGSGQTGTVNLKFPINNALIKGYSSGVSLRLVVYFKINDGTKWYHTDTIALNGSLKKKINGCATTTKKTSKKTTTSSKPAANGKKYINLHARVEDTYVSENHYVVPAIIENRSQQNIKVYYAKLTDGNNEKYAEVNVNQTIAKGSGQTGTVNLKFPINDALTKSYRTQGLLRLVVYFKINNGDKFYHTDTIRYLDPIYREMVGIKKGTTFVIHSVNNSEITVDKNCNLQVKAKVTNISPYEITITNSKLTSHDNNIIYATSKASGKYLTSKITNSDAIAVFNYANSGVIKALKNDGQILKMTTYFDVKTKGSSYWVEEKITVPKTALNKLNRCKVTTTKKVNTKLTLTCPEKSNINKTFKCTANQSGVTITLGGANSLASNVKPTFKTTAKDMTKDIKYTSALFKNYKSIIKKDEKGKEYINAKIVAKKSGYNNITKYVRIYR